jgi:hypothetical protein
VTNSEISQGRGYLLHSNRAPAPVTVRSTEGTTHMKWIKVEYIATPDELVIVEGTWSGGAILVLVNTPCDQWFHGTVARDDIARLIEW